MKSPLKYLGAKAWLVERLRVLYAPHRGRRFVDLCVGGGSAVLGVEPECALLCDVNPHLVNFWEQLRDPQLFELEMRCEEALYYAYRGCFNKLGRTSARWTRTAAELFWYLNKTGFRGVCRFNEAGEFNVPFGHYKKIEYRRDFSEYAPMLGRWDAKHCSFERAPLERDDFVFFDPPYDGTFVDYSVGGFDWAKQVCGAELLAAHHGPVVATNAATDRILALYKGLGFAVETLSAPRSVSVSGDRAPAMEMLATRNITPGGKEALS
jgi:DNA adenine methylase